MHDRCSECGRADDCLWESTGSGETNDAGSVIHVDFGTGETRVTDPETGGQKGRKAEEYALIPVAALAAEARVYGYGATKYAPNNWRKGYAWSLSYSAMMRHLNAFWRGEFYDPESGQPHLAHAKFHCNTLMTFFWEGLGTDDRSDA